MAEGCTDCAATLMAELWAVDLAAQQREADEFFEFGGDDDVWPTDVWPTGGVPGSCGGCYGRGCGCGEGM